MSIIVHMLTRKFILTSALRGSILSNFLNSIIAMPCDACNLGTNYMKMWVKGIEENAPFNLFEAYCVLLKLNTNLNL